MNVIYLMYFDYLVHGKSRNQWNIYKSLMVFFEYNFIDGL